LVVLIKAKILLTLGRHTVINAVMRVLL